MSRLKWIGAAVAVVLTCSFCAAYAGQNAAATLDIDLDTNTAGIQTTRNLAVNDLFYVDVYVQGAANLKAGSFDITWPTAKLQLQQEGISEGAFFGSAGGTTALSQDADLGPTVGDGTINVSGAILGATEATAPDGDGVLIRLQFKVLDASEAVIAFTSGILIDTDNQSFDDVEALGNTNDSTLNGDPLPPTQLAFTAQPVGPYQAGAAINAVPQVAVQDVNGQTVTTSTAAITIAIGTNPGGGTLSGTLTQNAVNGVATFAGLSIDKVGTGYTLAATSAGLTGATSDTFNIIPGDATKLVFTAQPEGPYEVNHTINAVPVVTVRDAHDNTVTDSAAAINMAIGTNPGGGTLAGTTPRNAVNGEATFNDLSINAVGDGYTLQATSAGLTAATSNAFNIIPESPGSVTRTLPGGYIAESPAAISLCVEPKAGTNAYAVEDVPPTGWTVSGINEGGTWDDVNKKVKWGTWFDDTARTLTYNATPPVGETGTKTFTGTGSFDGQDVDTGGDSQIQEGMYHPADYPTRNWTMVIGEVTGYGAAWKTGATWEVPPNPIPIGYVTNAGYLWKVGEVYQYNGLQDPPQCWEPPNGEGSRRAKATGTATRTLPDNYVAGQASAVSIVTAPEAGVAAYAVEDTPPADWTVSDINENGAWDDVNKKVKWGPWFDSTVRTLTYNATPPAGEEGTKTFVGVASYDGNDVDIAGDGDLPGGIFDNFNDNARGAMWYQIEEAPAEVWMHETNQRLELRATANAGDVDAMYVGRMWRLDTGTDFDVQVDWHFGAVMGDEADLFFAFGPDMDTYLEVGAGWDGAQQQAFFHVEGATDDVSFLEDGIARATNEGTFYISYDTALDRMYLSVNGPRRPADPANGDWVVNGIVQGTWGINSGFVTLGGFSENTALASGDVYYDDFEMADGTSVVPATRVLTVNSDVNDLAVEVRPEDNNNAGNGDTQFTRTYDVDIPVYVTAPATSGVMNFWKWQRDGADLAGGRAIETEMDANQTLNALYTGPAAQLVFTAQPVGPYQAGAVINAIPQVTVQDAAGHTIAGSTAAVTIGLDNNPAQGTLSGTLTQNAVNGVATFNDLSINRVGDGYALCATSPGLAGTASDAFNIIPGAPHHLAFLVSPGETPALGVLAPNPQVAIQDDCNNTVTGSAANVTVAIKAGTGTPGAVLGGTATVAAGNGVATFNDLTVSLAGDDYQLNATSAGVTAADSTAFDVTAEPALQIAKADDVDPVNAGGEITYTITYGNTGLAAATGVVITDAIPANTTYKAGSATGGGTYNANTNTVTWNVADIPATVVGLTVQFTVVVNADMSVGGMIVNTTYQIDCAETDAVAGVPVETTVNDTEPPEVVCRNPAADADEVSRNTIIEVEIRDKRLVGATGTVQAGGSGVNSATVNIQAKVGNGAFEQISDGSAEYDASANVVLKGICRRSGTAADGYTYTFQPAADFDYGQQVTVRVNASDLAANAMAQDEYSFTTIMRTFGANARVNSGASTHDLPATAMDADGNIWVVWEREATGAATADIYIAKLPAGGTAFEQEIFVGPAPAQGEVGDDRRKPSIAIANGMIYVAYQELDPVTGWNIFVDHATVADPNTWSDTDEIHPNHLAGNQTNPVIAVNSMGDAYVAFQSDDGGNNNIWVCSSVNPEAAAPAWVETQVTNLASEQTDPAMAIAPDDTVILAWTDARNPGRTDIYGGASDSVPAWDNVPLVSNANNQSLPAIAAEAAPGTTVHVLWVDDTTNANGDIWYGDIPGAPPVGNIENITDNAAAQTAPTIAVKGSGATVKVFAGWQDARWVDNNADTDICFAESGSPFGDYVKVNDDTGTAAQTSPAMAVDRNDSPYLVWADARDGNLNIYYAGATSIGNAIIDPADNVGNPPIGPAGGNTVGVDPDAVGPDAPGGGNVTIDVPLGAVDSAVSFGANRIENPPPLPANQSGANFAVPYEFTPSGLQFNVAVRIFMPVPAGDLPTGGNITLWFFNTTTGEWEADATAVYVAAASDLTTDPMILAFDVMHFTAFRGRRGGGLGAGGGVTGGGGGGLFGGCAMSRNGGSDILLLLLPWIAVGLLLVRALRRRKSAFADRD